jgi:hypothetical protein
MVSCWKAYLLWNSLSFILILFADDASSLYEGATYPLFRSKLLKGKGNIKRKHRRKNHSGGSKVVLSEQLILFLYNGKI